MPQGARPGGPPAALALQDGHAADVAVRRRRDEALPPRHRGGALPAVGLHLGVPHAQLGQPHARLLGAHQPPRRRRHPAGRQARGQVLAPRVCPGGLQRGRGQRAPEHLWRAQAPPRAHHHGEGEARGGQQHAGVAARGRHGARGRRRGRHHLVAHRVPPPRAARHQGRASLSPADSRSCTRSHQREGEQAPRAFPPEGGGGGGPRFCPVVPSACRGPHKRQPSLRAEGDGMQQRGTRASGTPPLRLAAAAALSSPSLSHF
mmetsp:Transcript_34474/g.81717  ORF Transcript_34474/g.81717 Transcript_34474/m.81717 type:complete len:261 (+) Transcript_34474:1950-2732(+)